VYGAGFKSVSALIKDKRVRSPQAANRAISEYKESIHSLEKLAGGFEASGNERMAAHAESTLSFSKNITYLIASIAALSLLAGVLISLTIARSISKPVFEMAAVARRLSRGELDSDIEVRSKDEVGALANAFRDTVFYIKGMAATAEAISEGDLTREIVVKSEKDVLGNAFRKMVGGLSSLVSQVRGGAEQIASAAAEVGATSEQSSKNGEMAATAVEEITSTMHEMSSNIQNVARSIQSQSAFVTENSASIEELIASIERVAENSRKLVALAGQSNDAVIAGKMAVDLSSGGVRNITNIMGDSADTIRLLGSRTEEIGKIIDVIDDIAEQTNLLALNAAIEAARAGEHGMGFAVVADEVRNLAERSAKSTAEISELIRGIQKDTGSAVQKVEKNADAVKDALKLSNEVVESLRRIELSVAEVARYSQEIGAATSEQAAGCGEISKAVSKLNDITQEISSSADEQASGTEQVVKGIEKLREMTAQNASSATQLASSAEQMRKQSESLNVTVAKFKTDGENTGKAAEKSGFGVNVKHLRLAAN
ncbi:MAG TPA: methyl-accepting chemotaxis protein, partial [Thermodesulfobacteriota bacterium]|nr:methyl-accepting chemotaxis protein [Thermodesulfobacteriota bacterium]